MTILATPKSKKKEKKIEKLKKKEIKKICSNKYTFIRTNQN